MTLNRKGMEDAYSQESLSLASTFTLMVVARFQCKETDRSLYV